MQQLYSEKERKMKLKEMTMVVDTREQKNEHITGYFGEKGIPYVNRKLDIGDYSFQLGGMSYEDEMVIEKKNSIDEIAGNFTKDRVRFEQEFLRAKANGTKVFLLIENCSWEQIRQHEYRSQIMPKALTASLLSWQVRYGITVMFCLPNATAELIYGTAYYWLKEKLVT